MLLIHEMVFEGPISVRAYLTKHLSVGYSDAFCKKKGDEALWMCMDF